MSIDSLVLDEEMTLFVNEEIASGRFRTPSEVVAAGLHVLKMEEEVYEEKMAILRAAIAHGDASGVVEGDIFDQVRAEVGLPPRRR